MANVIRDPQQHPDAVLGDFSSPEPLRTFTLDQVRRGAHLPLHHAPADGTIRHPEPLYLLPQGQEQRLGHGSTKELGHDVALARRDVMVSLAGQP